MSGAVRRLRIVVYEAASGGGFAKRALPPSLAREGRAMRDALATDLMTLGHDVSVATRDSLDRLLRHADAAWLIAPETGGHLERLTRRVSSAGVPVLGSDAAGICRAADKAGLARLMARQGLRHPATREARSLREARAAAHRIGFPVVLKPARGAGSAGVTLVRRPDDLQAAYCAARSARDRPLLVQRYVCGVPASVSLLAVGSRFRVLAVNRQSLRVGRGFVYRGGTTPLAHPIARRAARLAVGACRTVGGLRGYIGVDVVLAPDGPWIIEINPRLTTSYLGIRAAIGPRVAGAILEACRGRLPSRLPVLRRVRFTAAGRVFPA